VLAVVFLLIAVRQVGRFKLRIWQIMFGGACIVLLTGQITPPDALRAINADVMLFLFGMFVVGEALDRSGCLSWIADRLFHWISTPDQLILGLLLCFGLLSALLMNDTLAIIGTPLVLGLAARYRLPPKLMLMSLAVAITTGSVMSPIGNPQNLLVALNSGMTTPFVTFGVFLLVPTIVSFVIAWVVLHLFYRRELSDFTLASEIPAIPDQHLTSVVRFSLIIIVLLAGINIASSFLGGVLVIPLPLIALCAAAPVLILSPKRFEVIKAIDWCTLVFFAAMFVLMASVWQTGFFQSLVGTASLTSVPAILAISIILSQFISNVPFVALFQPLILQVGGTTRQLMALAAGSTIAGNLTILGAASNVIIIQKAEQQNETLTFFEFARIGIPIVLLQAGVYCIFLGIR
jgi:Na+/H+ antiporter NhaD/arsenite permease-like protein